MRRNLCYNCYDMADKFCEQCYKFICANCYPVLHKPTNKCGHTAIDIGQQDQALHKSQTQNDGGAPRSTASSSSAPIHSAPRGAPQPQPQPQHQRHRQAGVPTSPAAHAGPQRCGWHRCGSNGTATAVYYCLECAEHLCPDCNNLVHSEGNRANHTRENCEEQRRALELHSSRNVTDAVAVGGAAQAHGAGSHTTPQHHHDQNHVHAASASAVYGRTDDNLPPDGASTGMGGLALLAESSAPAWQDSEGEGDIEGEALGAWATSPGERPLSLDACLADPWLATGAEYVTVVKQWVGMCAQGVTPEDDELRKFQALLQACAVRSRLDVVQDMLRRFRWLLTKTDRSARAPGAVCWSAWAHGFDDCVRSIQGFLQERSNTVLAHIQPLHPAL